MWDRAKEEEPAGGGVKRGLEVLDACHCGEWRSQYADGDVCATWCGKPAPYVLSGQIKKWGTVTCFFSDDVIEYSSSRLKKQVTVPHFLRIDIAVG
jgi:hypothetical protein